MSLNIDVHILQPVPPCNLNRDESGRPKSAQYGGVRRARVSSQAWKHVIREDFRRRLGAGSVGARTLRSAELIADRICAADPSMDRKVAVQKAVDALKLATKPPQAGKTSKFFKVDKEDPGAGSTGGDGSAGVVKSSYMVLFSDDQLDAVATLVVGGEKLTAASLKKAVGDNNSIDLALFGRMVADDASLNVDASVQVAHAISTHAVDNEFDFYTAVDDESPDEETGAGMMGTIEFNSSVLYRYATVNVDLLAEQLAEEADVVTAVGEFVRAFVESMPTGKQNTFANGTLPDAVVVSARHDRGISFVGAFERPVRAGGEGGYLKGSASALAQYAEEVVTQYAAPAERTWVLRVGEATAALEGLGERVTLPALVEAIEGFVAESLEQA